MLAADAAVDREARLILALVRELLAPSEGRRPSAVPAADDIDWAGVVRLARAHGVLPVLRRAMVEHLGPAPRSDSRELVAEAADIAARRSLHMTSTLLDLLGVFAASGVVAVPWKGPVLAATLWSDVAMRQYADLDLLVRRADVRRARDILLGAGFRRVVDRPAWQEERYVERVGALELVRDSDAMVIEVHWTVVPNYFASAMAPEGIWERLAKITISRRTIMTLAPEDMLVALSIHGFKHRWERLGWIVDVARLLQVHRAMDWNGLLRLTRTDGSQRLVRIAVGLASELFGPAVPEEARTAIGTDAVATQIVGEIAPSVLLKVPDGHFVQSTRLDLRARERRRDRLAYFVSALTTPTLGDWATIRVPQRLSPIYVLVRPVRLVVRYIFGLGRGR